MTWPHQVGREPGADRTERSVSLGISLTLHALAFVALMEAPAVELPRASESEYRQAIAGKEEKIVWYKFRRELPRVTPPAAKPDKRPLRAETLAKQAMIAAPKNAPKREQMVWAPAPPSLAPPPLASPNVLAIRLPDQPFVAPPDLVRPPAAEVEVPDAPELKPVETASVKMPVKLPPRPFAAPPVKSQYKPTMVPLAAEAPALAANLETGTRPPGMAPNLPPRPFTAPAKPRSTPAAVSLAGEAPALAATLEAAPGAPGLASKLPLRPFTAPAGTGKTAPRAPALDAPPTSWDLNVAIVGLNPLERATTLPSAPSPATFSAGPKLNPDGATADGEGKGLTVPDLFVRGPRQNKPDLVAQAYAAPTSAETLRAAMRNGEPVMTVHAAPAPSARPGEPAPTKVSNAPDPRFNGRDVFMMAIQMPNLTSYSGSWLMWYADRTARHAGLEPISAPVPHRKVDPKYIPAAVDERVEGKVMLGCVVDREGHVSGVELIRGIDSRLNQSAQEALAKWEFYPALQNGRPVEVDVLVEIPFRLAPKAPRR